MTEPLRVLICGTGSGAHALAAVASTRPGVEVRVLSHSSDKAQRWTEIMQRQCLDVVGKEGQNDHAGWKANSFLVTDQPEQAVCGSDLIIITVPVFSHSRYLELIKPHMKEGSVVIGLPGQNGFEFEVRKTLGEKLRNYVIMNFESLPWSCRTVEFGETVRINGTKEKLVGALCGDVARAKLKDPLAALQRVLGERPKLSCSGDLLGITLMSLNAYSHPPIIHGRWKDWDGKPVTEKPLFFHGVDEETAETLGNISDEVVSTSRQIMAEHRAVDLSQVIPMYQWDIAHYGSQIKDKTNLMTALRTNPLYEGRTHPMIETESGKYIPDFNHRFMLEDLPCLVVIRGIAEIAGVETPNMDRVLSWGQEKLKKEYLVGSRLIGKDLETTRCPQKYGLTKIKQLLG